MGLKRKQAKLNGDKTYFTGKPCKNGHIAERYTSNFTCIECTFKQCISWMLNNKERQLDQRRNLYKKDTERFRLTSLKWRQNNPDKLRVCESRRKERTKQATPSWLTKEHFKQMSSLYWLAKLQQELTDTKYHIDHIIPLKGKTVCGLNVPWNLQVLEAKENIMKSNKLNINQRVWG